MFLGYLGINLITLVLFTRIFLLITRYIILNYYQGFTVTTVVFSNLLTRIYIYCYLYY